MTELKIYKSETAAARVHELYRTYLDSWEPLPEQMFVPTRHGETFVIASGPKLGPAVVLLHGTMAMSAMWREEIETLSKNHRA